MGKKFAPFSFGGGHSASMAFGTVRHPFRRGATGMMPLPPGGEAGLRIPAECVLRRRPADQPPRRRWAASAPPAVRHPGQ